MPNHIVMATRDLGPRDVQAIKLLVGHIRQTPRSTQRSCSGIRRSPKMFQLRHAQTLENQWVL